MNKRPNRLFSSTELPQSHIVVHLQIMTAHADNQANRQRAIRVGALVTVFALRRVHISVEAEGGFQQGSIAVAFGALDVESQWHQPFSRSSADYSDMPTTNKASRFSYCHYERPVSGLEESAL